MNRRERRAAAKASRQGRAAGPDPESPAARLHRSLAEAARARTSSILRSGRTPERLALVVDDAVGLGRSAMAESPTDPAAIACTKGCSHCCHRPVGTSAPSVLRIARWAREHLAPGELQGSLAKVVALDARTHGKTWTPRDRPPLACAFLLDGACQIYDVRPFVCRGWNSVSAAACERALGQDAAEIRFDLYQRTTYAAIERGIQLALGDAGLSGDDLELTAAVRVALEREDAAEAWLAGEPVFAGCEAKPPPVRRRLPFAP